jgi:hypothetical protein
MEEIVPLAFGGALIGFCIGLAKQKLKPCELNYTKALKFEPWYFSEDSECAQMFIKLQHHRDCAEKEFDAAGDATDSLFCLINTLSVGNIPWNSKYGKEANAHYIKIDRSLEEFAKKARYRLYDVPVLHMNKLAEDDVENEKILTERMTSGKISFFEIKGIKNAILERLKKHVLRLCSPM